MKIRKNYVFKNISKLTVNTYFQAGNCRVMAHCPPLATIVVSQPSSSPLFPGFGVKKVVF